MNSLIHLYSTIKLAREQKRVISKRKPTHRILAGGCVLYELPGIAISIHPDVSATAGTSDHERNSPAKVESSFRGHGDE